MGSASGGMQIIHVDSIRWAASLRKAGSHRSTHVQTCFAPKQLMYDILIDNGRQLNLDVKHKVNKWK